MGAGQREQLLVLGIAPIIYFECNFFEDGRRTAQVIIGIGNGTNNTFGRGFEDGRWQA